MLVQRAVDNQAAVVFVNTVGGQDELVFDGHSVAVEPRRRGPGARPQFEEALAFCTIDPGEVVAGAAARHPPPRQRAPPAARRPRRASRRARPEPPRRTRRRWTRSDGDVAPVLGSEEEEVYAALRTGLRDYVEKNGFERVVLGALGRHRLRARRADRGRRARARARDLRVHALPLLERGHPVRRARDRGQPRHRVPSSCRSRTRCESYSSSCSRESFEGTRARTSPRRTSRRASAATW